MIKTEKPWQHFEASVGAALRAHGYEVVSNTLVGHKKVDHFLEYKQFSKNRRVLVECKCISKKLTQKQLSEIYANYLPLLPRHADEILVVTNLGITDSAKSMAKECRNFDAITLEELLQNVFDFEPYLNGLINQFEGDGVSKYYVPLRSIEYNDFEEFLDEWVLDGNASPIAILGSYGQGKTTFAKYLACKWAIRRLESSRGRIPILFKLGDIGSEQSLEGLVGKNLTAHHYVRNYNFPTFMELNQSGHFAILLDGFDEMKQALSFAEFRHNFNQLNRLVSGNAKVILLGRPTAFVTENEQRSILHGERIVSGVMVKNPDWPDYTEIRLSQFSLGDVQTFLDKYYNYIIENSKDERLISRLKRFGRFFASQLADSGLGELARRPVQLKMISEVLPDFHGRLEELTKHTLYDYFIDYVIERESGKAARLLFDTVERRRFARYVAVWLWSGRRDSSFEQDAVPDEVLSPFLRSGLSIENVKRDLLSASLLDRVGARLHFPHRSIQEFLVAESIALNEPAYKDGREIANMLEPDLVGFLDDYLSDLQRDSLREKFEEYRGSLPYDFVRVLAKRTENPTYKNSNYRHRAKRIGNSRSRTLSPWQILMLAVSHAQGELPKDVFASAACRAVEESGSHRSILAIIFAAMIATRDVGRRGQILERVWSVAVKTIRTQLNAAKIEYMKHGPRVDFGVLESELLSAIKNLQIRPTGYADLRGTFKHIHKGLRNYVYINDWDGGEYFDYRSARVQTELHNLEGDIAVDVESILEDVSYLRRERGVKLKGN